METLLKNFEKYISYILITVASLYVVYQTTGLLWLFGSKIIDSIQNQTIDVESKGRPIAGMFFNILLIMEIVQTIRVFAKDHLLKIRIILLVGLIAVTRKLLMEDMKESAPQNELAIAALIVALSIGYFLVGRNSPKKEEQQ